VTSRTAGCSHYVTSMTAPVASGWSVRRVGLAPNNQRRPSVPYVSAERRPITVMFCDLVGSTSLAAKLDAEDWRNLVNA
jgi:class 3 adenylate cyclase